MPQKGVISAESLMALLYDLSKRLSDENKAKDELVGAHTCHIHIPGEEDTYLYLTDEDFARGPSRVSVCVAIAVLVVAWIKTTGQQLPAGSGVHVMQYEEEATAWMRSQPQQSLVAAPDRYEVWCEQPTGSPGPFSVLPRYTAHDQNRTDKYVLTADEAVAMFDDEQESEDDPVSTPIDTAASRAYRSANNPSVN